MRDASGTPVWQRNYYEHIIRNEALLKGGMNFGVGPLAHTKIHPKPSKNRNEASLRRIRQYIQTNPLSWRDDQLHPHNLAQ